MSVTKEQYGSSTAITITLTSLGDGNCRESAAVDNTSNLYLDALVYVACKLAAGSPASIQAINIYVYASEDGTNFGDNATGSDAALTMRSPTNLRLLGTIQTPDSGGVTYKSNPMSVARAFGGSLPRKWGIVVQNNSGLALDSSGNSASYTGVYLQAV